MKTIAFDLDGTLAHYTEWKDINHIGRPLKGAVNTINNLVNRGYDVVIFTTRTNPNVNTESVKQLKARIKMWLNDNGFSEAVRVEEYKPIALLYIDDHAMHVPKNCDWSHETTQHMLESAIEEL